MDWRKGMKYALICGNFFLLACGGYVTFHMISNTTVRLFLMLLFLAFCLMNFGSYLYFRSRFVALTSRICHCMEKIMKGKSAREIWNKETLTSKIAMELEKTERAVTFQISESKKEKKELQEMISEITHQIKTPLTNIKMYCEMGQTNTFSDVMTRQLLKVEFLLDALVKASRLETEMINLQPSNSKIIDTLAIAVNNVLHKAQQKQIEITVECRPFIQVYHDMKWTAEAIENIVDNAVKYTPENGEIHISVHVGEMFTEIKVEDNGKGIEPAHINDIFKRFYREKSVSGTEGLGLGLYLARKIITLQKGYIYVHSAVGKGSRFLVCLPNRV